MMNEVENTDYHDNEQDVIRFGDMIVDLVASINSLNNICKEKFTGFKKGETGYDGYNYLIACIYDDSVKDGLKKLVNDFNYINKFYEFLKTSPLYEF